MIENEIEDETKKEFKEVADAIQDFTTVLNKHNMAYKVVFWDSGEGYSIEVDDVNIDFYLSGAIRFSEKEKELEGEKDEKV
jgi:hypothetical protein